MQFPHCDQRILHAPGECEYCDLHAGWQELRRAWGIAFTGHAPAIDGNRCGKVIRACAQAATSRRQAQVCMQAAGHGDDIPHSPGEPWEALPCPADFAVQRRERGDHGLWPGNRASR